MLYLQIHLRIIRVNIHSTSLTQTHFYKYPLFDFQKYVLEHECLPKMAYMA